jgi:hypothetical protein
MGKTVQNVPLISAKMCHEPRPDFEKIATVCPFLFRFELCQLFRFELCHFGEPLKAHDYGLICASLRDQV